MRSRSSIEIHNSVNASWEQRPAAITSLSKKFFFHSASSTFTTNYRPCSALLSKTSMNDKPFFGKKLFITHSARATLAVRLLKRCLLRGESFRFRFLTSSLRWCVASGTGAGRKFAPRSKSCAFFCRQRLSLTIETDERARTVRLFDLRFTDHRGGGPFGRRYAVFGGYARAMVRQSRELRFVIRLRTDSRLRRPTLRRQAERISSEASFARSLQLIRDLGNAGLGASLLLRLAHRGAAQAHAADGFVADLDRNPAAERNDVGEHSLAGICCFG